MKINYLEIVSSFDMIDSKMLKIIINELRPKKLKIHVWGFDKIKFSELSVINYLILEEK